MRLTDSILDGVVVITIDGDLDHSNIGILNDLLAAHLDAGNHRLVFDLATCSYIDEVGREGLWTYLRTLRDPAMVRVAGPTPDIRRALHIAGLLGVGGFQLDDSVDTARSESAESLVEGQASKTGLPVAASSSWKTSPPCAPGWSDSKYET